MEDWGCGGGINGGMNGENEMGMTAEEAKGSCTVSKTGEKSESGGRCWSLHPSLKRVIRCVGICLSSNHVSLQGSNPFHRIKY